MFELSDLDSVLAGFEAQIKLMRGQIRTALDGGSPKVLPSLTGPQIKLGSTKVNLPDCFKLGQTIDIDVNLAALSDPEPDTKKAMERFWRVREDCLRAGLTGLIPDDFDFSDIGENELLAAFDIIVDHAGLYERIERKIGQ